MGAGCDVFHGPLGVTRRPDARLQLRRAKLFWVANTSVLWPPALAFGVLIVALVVAGSLWIMANLNANMMPMPSGELMNLRIQH